MTTIGRLLLLASALFLLGGCMTPEDRDFYGRGWINPSELDRPAPHQTRLPEFAGDVTDPIIDAPTTPYAARP